MLGPRHDAPRGKIPLRFLVGMTKGNWGRKSKEKYSFDHKLQNLYSSMGLLVFFTGVSLHFKKQEKKKLNTKTASRRRGFPICFPLSHSSMEERGEKRFNQKAILSFPCKVPGGGSRNVVPVPSSCSIIVECSRGNKEAESIQPPKAPGLVRNLGSAFQIQVFLYSEETRAL